MRAMAYTYTARPVGKVAANGGSSMFARFPHSELVAPTGLVVAPKHAFGSAVDSDNDADTECAACDAGTCEGHLLRLMPLPSRRRVVKEGGGFLLWP